MDSSIVSTKGQVLIPAKLRKKAGIKKGTRVFLEEKDGAIVIHPATLDFYERTCGILKGGGLLKALRESRQKEKKREDKKFERR